MSGIFDQVINYAPPSLLKGTVTYKGTWSAATNTPTLINPPDSTTNGFYYVVSAAGTQFSLVFNINDWIISNGSAWQKVDNTDSVDSVFGRTGAVVGVSTDYSSVGITATAVGASSPSTGAFTTLSSTSTTTLNSTTIPASKTLVVTTDKISVLAATTSAELAGVISDETGSGSLVFATLPTFGATGVKLSGSTSGTTTVLSGATAGTSVLTLPVATDTLVGKATTDTLTNKTLTSPTITGGALNGTLGATTPSTVAATSGTFSGNVGLTNGKLTIASAGNDNGVDLSGSSTNLTSISFVNSNASSIRWNWGIQGGTYATAGTMSLNLSGVGDAITVNGSTRSVSLPAGLNSTAIGATTPSTGAFSTLSASSTLDVGSTSTLHFTQLTNNDQSNCRLRFINTGSGGQTWDILGGTNGASNAGLGFLNGSTTYMQLTTAGAAVTGTLSSSNTFSTFNNSTQELWRSVWDGGNTGGISSPSGRGLYLTTSGTASTQGVFIDGSGKVGIGTTSPSGKLTVVCATTPILSTFTSTLGGYDSYSTDDASGARFFACFNSAGSVIGSISRVTTTNAVAFNTTSDGRLKENLREFTDSGRLIDALKPRVFDWKNSDDNGKGVIGFIAQEEHAADPIFAHIGAVSVGDDDPDTITKQWQRSDAALIPILVAELQSLRKRLAVLESK